MRFFLAKLSTSSSQCLRKEFQHGLFKIICVNVPSDHLQRRGSQHGVHKCITRCIASRHCFCFSNDYRLAYHRYMKYFIVLCRIETITKDILIYVKMSEHHEQLTKVIHQIKQVGLKQEIRIHQELH